MKGLDVNSIKPKVEINIKRKLADNPDFVPTKVEKVSVAAKAICEWVRAVANFTDVSKQINAKKEIVSRMNAELEKANAELS
jgi:dynein heavy chain